MVSASIVNEVEVRVFVSSAWFSAEERSVVMMVHRCTRSLGGRVLSSIHIISVPSLSRGLVITSTRITLVE